MSSAKAALESDTKVILSDITELFSGFVVFFSGLLT